MEGIVYRIGYTRPLTRVKHSNIIIHFKTNNFERQNVKYYIRLCACVCVHIQQCRFSEVMRVL